MTTALKPVDFNQPDEGSSLPRRDDEREDGEAFCHDCPDHEGCMTGYPCWLVKQLDGVAKARRGLK